MRTICRMIPAAMLLALFVGRAPAEDDVKAVVEKAVKAHGGEEKLSKFKGTTSKLKGKISLGGMDIDFEAKASNQMPNKSREEIKASVMGMELTIVQVYDGKNGWASMMGNVMEVEGDQLESMKANVRDDYLATILPLAKDKSLKLTAIEEIKVDGKPAAGIKVSAEGYKDVKMYFDKDSGLLVKLERKAHDPMQQEVNSETFFRDYKDVSGVKNPMKIEVKHDGNKFVDAEVTEIKMMEKQDESLFKKPE